MPNLMTHLKKVSEQKPQATYYNVDMLKYQVWCSVRLNSAKSMCGSVGGLMCRRWGFHRQRRWGVLCWGSRYGTLLGAQHKLSM